MPSSVRIADLVEDRERILTCLNENLPQRHHAAWFEWLYLRNPHGSARVWIAIEQAHGQTVGVAAAFPRVVSVGGQHERAWVLGDFCVERRSRSLGPALMLQRACLRELRSERCLIYDFPSEAMMGIYRRLGVTPIGHQVRYVKLYRVDERLRGLLASPKLMQLANLVGNGMLSVRNSLYDRNSSVDVGVHEGAYGDEFSELENKLAAADSMRIAKSIEFLKWRYLEHPADSYLTVAAHRGAKCLGYAVVRIEKSEWTVADIQAVEKDSVIPAILTCLDACARSDRVTRVSIPAMDTSYLTPHLLAAGYAARESRVVVTDERGAKAYQFGERPRPWALMAGDADA